MARNRFLLKREDEIIVYIDLKYCLKYTFMLNFDIGDTRVHYCIRY